MSAAVLDALEARAGASDADREAWLAERRQGITATEIRDLLLKKIAMPTLIERKLGRRPESDWTGPYAAWGREREPLIAADVEQRWSIRPERRVFRAADNARFLMSPDGIGVNFDEEIIGAEIKTGDPKDPLHPWAPAFVKLGYDLQCQWGMRVTGARRWLFAWEERYGVPGEFWAGERHFHWVERDDDLIARMERYALGFLVEFDRVADEPYVPGEVDEELDTHAVNYLRFLQEEKEAGEAKKREWAAMLAAKRSQVSTLARVSYSPPVATEVEETDWDAARAAEGGAELFEALQTAQAAWDAHSAQFTKTKQVKGRPNLRVTAVKQKEVSGE